MSFDAAGLRRHSDETQSPVRYSGRVAAARNRRENGSLFLLAGSRIKNKETRRNFPVRLLLKSSCPASLSGGMRACFAVWPACRG